MSETKIKYQAIREGSLFSSLVNSNQKQIQVGVMLISSSSRTVPSILDDTPQSTGDLNSKDRREMVDVCCSSFVDNKKRDSSNGYECLEHTLLRHIEFVVGGRGWYRISMV